MLAVGPQPSVIRAAVSGCAVSIAWLVARERDQWHVLALAAVVLLGWNPYMLFDAGFQLSFAAVVAIFLFAKPLLRVLEGYPVHPKLGAALAISLACSLMTAPILLRPVRAGAGARRRRQRARRAGRSGRSSGSRW